MTTEQWFVETALSYVGRHYVWGGKGDKLFKDGKLIANPFVELQAPLTMMPVFDCSGLVNYCLMVATNGKLDLRGSHSAQTILDTWPLATVDNGDGTVKLYPGHVAIDLGRGRVVEAAGGDHTTTSIQAAIDRDAKVRAGSDLRGPSTLLGLRRIPLDKSELRVV